MADKVTQKDGSWSDTTVWNGGTLPTSGQTIQISHNIIYDSDNTLHAAGYGAISIDAGKSITASTTAGNYYMKMAGSITGAGAGAELRAGTSETAYPSNCTFTIYLNGDYNIDGGASNTLTCKFYCYDPPVKYLRLISATPKAITGISKAATCTVTCVGHGYSGGDTIYLVNVGGMVELNNLRVKVKTVLTDDTFTLRAYDTDVEIDSTSFTTYTSGGYVCPETAEAVAQTQLEVDQNVSADAEWTRSGATVNIDNVARAKDSESRTIASVAAGSVTVTAGLTAAKHSSSLVILTSRNVKLQSSATNITNGIVYRGNGHILRCAIIAGNASTNAMSTVTDTTMSGVTSGCNYVFNVSGTGCLLSGVSTNSLRVIYGGTGTTVTGLVSGSADVLRQCTNTVFSGMASGCGQVVYMGTGNILSGTITGCKYGFYTANNISFSGILSGCLYGLYYCGGVELINSKIVGCSSGLVYVAWSTMVNCSVAASASDLLFCSNIMMINTVLASSVENSGYGSCLAGSLVVSNDHDATTGAFRAWTSGGITSSTATDPPTGRVRSYQTVCESATYPGWYQREIVVDAGRQLRIRFWLKADAGVEIKAQLVLPTADPLITGTGTGEWQQIGTSDGTWYEYVTSWTNSATYPVKIYARVLSTAASGNGYSDMMWAFDRTPLVR